MRLNFHLSTYNPPFFFAFSPLPVIIIPPRRPLKYEIIIYKQVNRDSRAIIHYDVRTHKCRHVPAHDYFFYFEIIIENHHSGLLIAVFYSAQETFTRDRVPNKPTMKFDVPTRVVDADMIIAAVQRYLIAKTMSS